MRTIELEAATDSLAEYVRHVNEEPIILTVNGTPVAAVVPIENADLETVALSTHREFLAIIERSRARLQREGGVSSEEMRRRLG